MNRILQAIAVEILSTLATNVEERRIIWNTYNNLKSLFDTWENYLEDLGFSERDEEGDIYIPVEQLSCIINVNESCLSLGGSNRHRGGRPEALCYCPSLPQTGSYTGKSIMTTTLITGSTAAGEAIPPRFQFLAKAQTAETEIFRVELVAYMPHFRGNFGAPEEQAWPITVVMNARVSMDDVEFDEYLSNSLIPLYPGAEDVKGKKVIFNLDSGPGRLIMKLLAQIFLIGFIFYPGVPNTTAVSQETDRNYVPFKTVFRIILDGP